LVEAPKQVGPNKEYENKHEWTMFVRLENKNDSIRKYIRKVKYGLHPTFGVTE
jgi:transcription initiation factor IIF auxiliary subunit